MTKYCKKLELTTKKSDTTFENVTIKQSSDAYNIIRKFWHEDISIYESFFILILNQANRTIAYAKISQGGTAGTIVDAKIIAKYALDCLSPALILAHNHPSGAPNPSKADISITKKIKEGLSLLDITVLDHLILFENGYTSMADENYM
jgi:DNA repair protein RadC